MYLTVLDVYGPTAHDQWLMNVPSSDGSRGSAGPTSSRALTGGMEYTYQSMVELYAPDYAPVSVTSEQVIDASSSPPVYQYTRLFYQSGGTTITTKDCTA